MSLSVAFCPHPPLLVPAVDASQVTELLELRAAAQAVVKELLSSGPERIVVVGAASAPVSLDESAGADFAPFGVPHVVGGPDHRLELPHAVGAWLLDDAGWDGPRSYTDGPAAPATRDAWLVMADGTTRRTEKAPGSFDPRAEAFDAEIVSALASGDPARLASLDQELALELGAAGVPTLAAVGRALAQQSPAAALVRHDGAPLGVGSWVADWSFA
ncbi:hypothetical protein ASD11_08015 [Aeromicrobium sp. Root495]|uniref:hypothetical protein n=1 Tax=Aeromicrobium sp. Root495 TaxID=1736550 RepID=UPI0006FF7640|nr:hypothetical protein [Aeromicrobium sp. Root495]KQY59497.1 hypothetical protein ASD11_08015 [Aeromicrobium sp. Root495]